MQRSFRSGAAAAFVLLLGVSACAGRGDASAEDITARVADQLSSDGGLDDDTAECVAGLIVDEVGVKEIDEVDFAAEAPPKALQEQLASVALLARERCDVDLDSLEE